MKRLAYLLIGVATLALTACSGSKGSDVEVVEDSVVAEDAQAEASIADGPISSESVMAMIAPGQSVDTPIVIDFNATWCGPCKQFGPVFHKLAGEYASKARFEAIDIDENPDLAKLFNVNAIPAVAVIYPASMKRPHLMHEGAMNEEQFREFLNETLK